MTVGMWGAHFDPPSPEDLALAWDTKNPSQRLRAPTTLDELRDCWAADGTPACGLFRRDHQ